MKAFISKNEDVLNKVGIFAGSLLVVVMAAYIYSPVVRTNAAETAEQHVTLNVGGVVGIRANMNELDLTASSGSFVSAPVNVDVTSNSQYGYTLTLEDVDSNTNMVSTEVSDVVSSGFSVSKTSSTMSENNWGYSLDNTDFYAIPVNGSPATLKRTSTVMTTTYETTPVYFGVKVGMHLPATTYADVVRFTAYVNGEDETPDQSAVTMQTFDGSTMLLNVGDSANLEDERDGNFYTVKRLADGNVWMTQNLRITNKTLTSADSNLPSGESFTIPVSDLSSVTTEYNKSVAYVIPTYGGYYNFYTATAGWGEYDVKWSTSPKDICPKGWRLPTGGDDSGEFQELYDQYNSSALMQGDPNFVFSGEIYNGTERYQGSYGVYWSSTARYTYDAYYIFLNDTSVYSGATNKNYAAPVRCIAK